MAEAAACSATLGRWRRKRAARGRQRATARRGARACGGGGFDLGKRGERGVSGLARGERCDLGLWPPRFPVISMTG